MTYGKCQAAWVGGYDVAISCVYDWPHPGSHRNETGTTWDQAPPLTCAVCGSQRWNDESVHWLPLSGDERRPYCAETCANPGYQASTDPLSTDANAPSSLRGNSGDAEL